MALTLTSALRAVIDALIGRKTKYLALYPCSVAGSSGGLLELIPDDATVRGTGLQGVKLRHGLPGFEVIVPDGARVLLGFESGDPTRPYALLWDEDPGSVDRVTFDGGSEYVARTADEIDFYVSYGPGGPPDLYFRRDPASPWLGPAPIGTGVGPAPAPADPGIQVGGVITTGNSKLRA